MISLAVHTLLDQLDNPYTARALPGCTAASRCSCLPFYSDGARSYSAGGWVMSQLPCLGKSRWGSRAGEALVSGTQFRHACTLSSLVRLCHELGSADEQCHWFVLLGHGRQRLSMPRSICWLLQTPPYLSVTMRFPVVKPSQFLLNLCEARLE